MKVAINWKSINAMKIVHFSFSERDRKWGLLPTFGDEYHMYICEIKKINLDNIIIEDRPPDYGYEVIDPLRIPHGPYFIQQPVDQTFDGAKRDNLNFVELQ